MKKLLSLFLSFFLILPVYSAGKSTTYPSQGVIVFKGLDDTSSPINVQDHRASDLQNVKLNNSLTLAKRDGYSLIDNRINQKEIDGTQFPAILGLYHTKFSNGIDSIFAISGSKLYYLNSGSWTIISGTNLTYNQNYQFQFVTGLDSVIFTNDFDVPHEVTSSYVASPLDLSDLSDALTKVKTLAWFRNYLILGNTVEAGTERPTRIRWSDVGTTETYQDDSFIDIAALGGQEINGLIELYDNLYVLMTDSIWKVTLVGGTEIFNVSKVVDNIGCIARNSIQSINFLNQRKGIVFLSKDKRVHFFDGTNIVELTTLINGTMDDLNAARLQYAVSSTDPDDYYLCVTTGSAATTNNLLLDFHFKLAEWTKHTQIDANAMYSVVDSNSLRQIYFGNYKSLVYQMDNTSSSNDIAGISGGISRIDTTYNLADSTATGISILYTDSPISSDATGAIITFTSGTGSSQEAVVVDMISTGLIVDTTFTTNPDDTTLFTTGAIDAYYTTKWYDLGEPALRKHMAQAYLWADSASGVDMDIDQSLDFSSPINNQIVSLQGIGALWGSALWGVGVWGGEEALFKVVKLSSTGRHCRLKFSNDDIGENFNLYGFKFIFWTEDIQ